MVTKIPMGSSYYTKAILPSNWKDEMAEMLKRQLRGETNFVEFDLSIHPKRGGSIGKFVFTNVQELVSGQRYYYRSRYSSTPVEEIESNVKPEHFGPVHIQGYVKWNGRSNRVTTFGACDLVWLKDYDESLGTVWSWKKPDLPPAVVPKDKLGMDIKVGDFISYILYHFDNDYNAAGLYYGRVTKVENDGTVWAKNMKLKDSDKSEEKRIKDNSLVVGMTKDLMDRLMLARLSF
jgi:hypothetical protein